MARILTKSPKPGIYPNVPMATYLAFDAWGASDLRAMLKGPEACRFAKYEAEEKSGDLQDFGTLAHMALLEPKRWPPEKVAWVEGPYNANPGKRDKAEAEDAGFTVFKPDVKARVESLVKRVREHERIRKLLDLSNGDADREVVAIAKCPVTGLMLKARADLRAKNIRTIADLKTTTLGTDRDSFENHVWTYGHYTSAPHYCEVFSQADPKYPIDLFLYVVADQDPPHTPGVYVLDELTSKAGSDLNDYFRRRVAECLKDPRKWKESSTAVEPVGLSRWRLDRIQALLEKEQAAHA